MEAEIINRQLHFPHSQTNLVTVFRYATTGDYVILAASALCALVAGALIPIPPVRTQSMAHVRLRQTC